MKRALEDASEVEITVTGRRSAARSRFRSGSSSRAPGSISCPWGDPTSTGTGTCRRRRRPHRRRRYGDDGDC